MHQPEGSYHTDYAHGHLDYITVISIVQIEKAGEEGNLCCNSQDRVGFCILFTPKINDMR